MSAPRRTARFRKRTNDNHVRWAAPDPGPCCLGSPFVLGRQFLLLGGLSTIPTPPDSPSDGVGSSDQPDAPTVITSVIVPVPPSLVAVTVTAQLPAVVGVPLMVPATGSTDNPSGNPVAP